MKFAHIIPFFFSLLFLRFSVFSIKKNKMLFYAFIICFLAFNAVFSWPFFTGDMNGYLKKTTFEKNYYEENVTDIKLINSTQAKLLNYTQIDPSTYSAWVDSSASFEIFFGNKYDPSWVAYVKSKEYAPISSNNSYNVYQINEIGLNEIRIEYLPQRWFYIGAIIGIVGILLSIIYVKRFES
jgi:hypothetical protein